MSHGYASRLSEYPDKGLCGLPEIFDSSRAIKSKTAKLAKLMEEAARVILITGAGISTAAGVNDFRGPEGVWTKEQEEKRALKNPSPSKKRKRLQETSKYFRQPPLEKLTDAKPTICHRAITKLVSVGKVQYVLSQNVDGLHKKAGLSRNKHSAVHGCVFTEKCEDCSAEFFRDFDVGGMSFQQTGRLCSICNGILRDTLLDWEGELPEEFFDIKEEIKKPGTLLLCLGTSLRIAPVNMLPLEASKFVIVNLQKTERDEQAALIIRGAVDEVMGELMPLLGYPGWHNEVAPEIERIWAPKSKNDQSET